MNEYVKSIFYGQSQRGVCTAEDGRKAESSSAHYLPLFTRTCLVESSTAWIECKKIYFLLSNSTIASNEFVVDDFNCAHVPPTILRNLYWKNKKNWKFTTEMKKKKKEKKKSEEKRSKEKKEQEGK